MFKSGFGDREETVCGKRDMVEDYEIIYCIGLVNYLAA
jgi:hypothetical protein